MANTGKSGYEIRADLLNQAQCILQDNQQRAADAIMYNNEYSDCLLYTSPSPRDRTRSRMPSSA